MVTFNSYFTLKKNLNGCRTSCVDIIIWFFSFNLFSAFSDVKPSNSMWLKE